MTEITRRIIFYQVSWNKDGVPIGKDLNFLNSILLKIPMITTADSLFKIYIENVNEKDLISANKDKSFWKISKIKKVDYPLKFNEYDYTSSSLDLKEHEGLQFPAHFISFDGHYIGAELSNDAPRVATTLYREINKLLEKRDDDGEKLIKDVDEFVITPMMREDAYKKIGKMNEITSVEMQISTNYARTLNENSTDRSYSFGETFSSAEVAEDLFLNLRFGVGRGGKAKPKKSFGKIIPDFISALKRADSPESIRIAKIRGRQFGTDMLETINLLDDYIMISREVTRLNIQTRAVDSIDMYKKILGSYKTLKPDILQYSKPIQR